MPTLILFTQCGDLPPRCACAIRQTGNHGGLLPWMRAGSGDGGPNFRLQATIAHTLSGYVPNAAARADE
jgi:hypothetical protein